MCLAALVSCEPAETGPAAGGGNTRLAPAHVNRILSQQEVEAYVNAENRSPGLCRQCWMCGASQLLDDFLQLNGEQEISLLLAFETDFKS